MTTRIKEFVAANQWIIRIVKDAFDTECLVVDSLSALSRVEIIPGINLFKEGETWYVEDFSDQIMPIHESSKFFREKANTLKTIRKINLGRG